MRSSILVKPVTLVSMHQILNLLDNDVKSDENYRKLKWFLGFFRIDRVISDDIL